MAGPPGRHRRVRPGPQPPGLDRSSQGPDRSTAARLQSLPPPGGGGGRRAPGAAVGIGARVLLQQWRGGQRSGAQVGAQVPALPRAPGARGIRGPRGRLPRTHLRGAVGDPHRALPGALRAAARSGALGRSQRRRRSRSSHRRAPAGGPDPGTGSGRRRYSSADPGVPAGRARPVRSQRDGFDPRRSAVRLRPDGQLPGGRSRGREARPRDVGQAPGRRNSDRRPAGRRRFHRRARPRRPRQHLRRGSPGGPRRLRLPARVGGG